MNLKLFITVGKSFAFPQVIFGLVFPPYIAKLEFKSKEELQLMPQTEEEHLIGLEEENETTEGTKPLEGHRTAEHDGEVINIALFPIIESIKTRLYSEQF